MYQQVHRFAASPSSKVLGNAIFIFCLAANVDFVVRQFSNRGQLGIASCSHSERHCNFSKPWKCCALSITSFNMSFLAKLCKVFHLDAKPFFLRRGPLLKSECQSANTYKNCTRKMWRLISVGYSHSTVSS